MAWFAFVKKSSWREIVSVSVFKFEAEMDSLRPIVLVATRTGSVTVDLMVTLILHGELTSSQLTARFKLPTGSGRLSRPAIAKGVSQKGR